MWYDFEKPVGGHGNEDTFREMLRIKRSIQAQYNTQVNPFPLSSSPSPLSLPPSSSFSSSSSRCHSLQHFINFINQVNLDQLLAAAKKADAAEQGKTQTDMMADLDAGSFSSKGEWEEERGREDKKR